MKLSSVFFTLAILTGLGGVGYWLVFFLKLIDFPYVALALMTFCPMLLIFSDLLQSKEREEDRPFSGKGGKKLAKRYQIDKDREHPARY